MPITKRSTVPADLDYVEQPVFVKELNANDFALVADACRDMESKSQEQQVFAMAFVCCLSCVDEAGDRIFADAQAALNETFQFLSDICEIAFVVNGLADDGEADDPKP